jgi:acid phosphatase type 7
MDTGLPYKVNATQYNFVKEDLNAASLNSTIDWIFVMFHRPMYSSHAAHAGSDTLRTAYHQLFSEYGVDLVLQSHNHLYERMLPLQFNSKDPGEPIIDITKTSTNSSICEPI